MKNIGLLILAILIITACQKKEQPNNKVQPIEHTSLIILGTLQDGGMPHIGCKKDCCKEKFKHPDSSKKVVSLGLIDVETKRTYIFESSPDFPTQLKALQKRASFPSKETPDGIFLTHAHIGHYSGLMYLGKEALNSDKVSVYSMPRMKTFLENNGPWSQLVQLNNISLTSLYNNAPIELSSQIKVTPLQVPHRDEFSETVGYIIEGPSKKALFIPDIDKWEKWNQNIISLIATVDYAFIDGTFYDAAEINHRDIKEIPHPFIIETMSLCKDLAPTEKSKIYFIHFNHTNPVLAKDSEAAKTVIKNGFHIAEINQVIIL